MIVVLTLAEEATKARLLRRHGDRQEAVEAMAGAGLEDIYHLQPVGEEEQRVVSVEVGETMTEEEVVRVIMETCNTFFS